jgi:hypothetical protein
MREAVRIKSTNPCERLPFSGSASNSATINQRAVCAGVAERLSPIAGNNCPLSDTNSGQVSSGDVGDG